MAEVQTPNCLAISAIAIPYSRLKIHAIFARTRETLHLCPPTLSSPSGTPSFLHVSLMTRSVKTPLSLAGRYLFTLWSASRKISATKSPPPKIRASYSTFPPCPLKDKTSDHPPKLRTNPPPTNSGRLPWSFPSSINFR